MGGAGIASHASELGPMLTEQPTGSSIMRATADQNAWTGPRSESHEIRSIVMEPMSIFLLGCCFGFATGFMAAVMMLDSNIR
jgi:hypothetical protein